jgi:hypothetical protein
VVIGAFPLGGRGPLPSWSLGPVALSPEHAAKNSRLPTKAEYLIPHPRSRIIPDRFILAY